jgi:hypothetical protein
MKIPMDCKVEVLLNFLASIYNTLSGYWHPLLLNLTHLLLLHFEGPLLARVPPLLSISEEVDGRGWPLR